MSLTSQARITTAPQSVPKMGTRERTLRQRCKSDFEYFATRCLKIRTKSGEILPFIMNKAQRYLHERIEQQLRETGRVRVNILKGRQQGCSTYVEGRYYWKTIHRKGVRTFILTQEDDATKNLFEMAQMFHDYNNPLLKPATGTANAKEMLFHRLKSGYKVGTAGNKTVGRSSTIQYFHGSEVAYWMNAAEHAKGIMQAIPNEDGTEAIRESTANGVGNYFHQQWKAAERGEGDYINVFIPWYWQDEYRARVPEGFARTDEEERLSENYGLDDSQLVWRRNKIVELSINGADGKAAFMQEYPCNAAEAFQMTGQIGLIKPKDVVKARKSQVNGNGPLIVGVDDSRGGDRFSAIKRQGRKAYDLESYSGGAVDTLGKRVAICKRILDTKCPLADKIPDMMFIDAGGGADLVDRLHELGYEERVKAISFAATSLEPDKWPIKRDEMWGKLNEWLTDENLDVQVPDVDSLQADLCASLYKRDSHDRVKLLSKDKIKEELGFSPDEGDALALTFAEPVKPKQPIPKPNLKYIV